MKLFDMFKKKDSLNDDTSIKPDIIIESINSPDQNHTAQLITNSKKVFIVIDGKKGKEYDGISPESIVFSPDSSRLAFRAKKLDEKLYKQYKTKGLGLLGLEKAVKKLVVVDEKEHDGYDGSISEAIIFSPNSRHFAYQAFILGREFVVVDGIKGKDYRMASTPVFGPDSEHIAYVASRNGSTFFAVFDGKESQECEEMPWFNIVFDGPTTLIASIKLNDKACKLCLELTGTGLHENIIS
jgi:hypothetical protein